MMNFCKILCVGAFVYASLLLEVAAWKLDRGIPINGIPIGGIFSMPNLDMNSFIQDKFSIFRVEDGWYFNTKEKEFCSMSCRLFACIFQRRPTEQEICQQPRYKDHSCCIRHTGQTTERPVYIDISSILSNTTTTGRPGASISSVHVQIPQKYVEEKKVKTAEEPVK